MTHPETRQLREDENEYQRGLDAAEERERAIDLEVSFLRVDIGAKNQAREFIDGWIDDPSGMLGEIIRQACLHNRAQATKLGEWLQTYVNDELYQAAETTVDRRLK